MATDRTSIEQAAETGVQEVSVDGTSTKQRNADDWIKLRNYVKGEEAAENGVSGVRIRPISFINRR